MYNTDLSCVLRSSLGRSDEGKSTDDQAPQQPTVCNLVSEDAAERQMKRRKTEHTVNSESSVGNIPPAPTQPPVPEDMAIETPVDVELAGEELMGGPPKDVPTDKPDKPGPSARGKAKGAKRQKKAKGKAAAEAREAALESDLPKPRLE